MSLIAACLRQPSLIVSVMGPHAGETPDGIFKRKVKDIEKVGWTLWVIRSHGASADVSTSGNTSSEAAVTATPMNE